MTTIAEIGERFERALREGRVIAEGKNAACSWTVVDYFDGNFRGDLDGNRRSGFGYSSNPYFGSADEAIAETKARAARWLEEFKRERKQPRRERDQ